MSPFDYLSRPEPFNALGTPYQNDAATRDPGLSGFFGGVAPATDPSRYGVMNALAGRNGGQDEAWASTAGSPWQRGPVQEMARNVLASEPVNIALNAANFLSPMLGRFGRLSGAEGGIRAYHGSPYDFKRFDIAKIGTGEGNQAYGPGLYFAENEAVAKGYRDRLSGNGSPGRVYEVRINSSPDNFLNWDVPLSEQSSVVKKAFEGRKLDGLYDLNGKMIPPEQRTGEGLFHSIVTDDPIASAKFLKDSGIHGTRYLDAGSRGVDTNPTYNYAVFDPSIIKILRKYGVAGLLSASAVAGNGQNADAAP